PGTCQPAPPLLSLSGTPLPIKTTLFDTVHLNFNPAVPMPLRLNFCVCTWRAWDVELISPLGNLLCLALSSGYLLVDAGIVLMNH
ncbi:hypothetical protein QBC32DRAFT_186694, partial [Pseudoneurospora amorphoporcata]